MKEKREVGLVMVTGSAVEILIDLKQKLLAILYAARSGLFKLDSGRWHPAWRLLLCGPLMSTLSVLGLLSKPERQANCTKIINLSEADMKAILRPIQDSLTEI